MGMYSVGRRNYYKCNKWRKNCHFTKTNIVYVPLSFYNIQRREHQVRQVSLRMRGQAQGTSSGHLWGVGLDLTSVCL